MSEDTQERQPADQVREEWAKEQFPYQSMTPEEYAARHGADWGCFSFDEYCYKDEQLDAWIQRLGTIFFTPGLLRKIQEQVLTPDELRQVRERMKEPF